MFPVWEPPGSRVRSTVGPVAKADLGTMTHPFGGIPMGAPDDPVGLLGCDTATGCRGAVLPRVHL